MKDFDHQKIEKKWQEEWLRRGVYQPDLQSSKKPFYNLMMFPYPSAEGLHVGNMYAFTGADVYGRFQRMQGKDVFQPIGLDGFGIHSENYAIKVGKHPSEQAKVSEERFYKQLLEIGNGFSWNNRLETYDPEYYRWTQWLFVQMYKHGLVEKRPSRVNWCPSCKTVLADEQVEGGICERCKSETIKKKTEQWFFKITDYADRLLNNIEKIEWPKKIKIAQENWIGRSEGLSIDFRIEGIKEPVTIWTKFWETVFGTTYLVLAPEHWVIGKMEIPRQYQEKVQRYIKQAINKTDQQRLAGAGEKTGVFMGVMAVNPVNGEEVPVWVADYVLQDVGTGAVMGVPAHDERDFAFARKYQLPVRKVVDVQVETHCLVLKESVRPNFVKEVEKLGWYWMDYQGCGYGLVLPEGEESKLVELVQNYLKDGPWYVHTDGATKLVIFKEKLFGIEKENEAARAYAREKGIPEEQLNWDELDNYMFCHEKGGMLVNSHQFNGLDAWGQGKNRMAEWMIKGGFARWDITYHLRDWIISRQRYWGPPIPMSYCEKCGWQPVPEKELPVLLPEIKEYEPSGDGKSPLEKAPNSWLYTHCAKCGGKAKRETDVSDTFLDSSWYFLAYPNLFSKEWKSLKAPFNREITKKWLPVNAYIGGAEHAVLHLLYSRFVSMALYDWGYLSFEEPFPFLFSHGLIIKDGAKMSKSRGNVVVPDDYIKKYGADTLRTYLMFLGPYSRGGDFRDSGIAGMHKFLRRIWRLYQKSENKTGKDIDKDLTGKLQITIKKVTRDIGKFKYNTAIAATMEFINAWESQGRLSVTDALKFLQLLAPFMPHLTEELWQDLKKHTSYQSIHLSMWPSHDEKLIKQDEVVVVVQVNGKVRSRIKMPVRMGEDKGSVIVKAKKDKKVVKYLEKKKIRNTVFVKGRLVNFVV